MKNARDDKALRFNLTLNKTEEERGPSTLVALFILLIIGIIASGFYYFTQYEKNNRAKFDHLLSSIADLKVSELVQWRKERLADAAILSGNESFVQLTRRLMEHSADKDAEKSMQRWLYNIQTTYQYKGVILLDAAGGLRLAAVGTEPSVCDHIKNNIAQIQQGDKPAFLDFHRETQSGSITLSVLAPIFDKKRLVGVVAMVIDPEVYLFPMIRSWPTPSETAETLLVHKEGSEVVFLNELKFQKGTALNLRFPLSRDDLPAARAVRGENLVMEGIDYRGVPVVAALRTVPDSPWFMVARMDKEEIYAPLREQFWIMIVLVFALIGGAGGGVLFLWQRRNNRFNARQLEAAHALKESEEKFRQIFEAANVGKSITRPSGEMQVNAAFCTMLGYTQEELTRIKWQALTHPDDIESNQKMLEPLLAGETDASRFTKRYLHKNGSIVWADVSVKLVRDPDHQPLYFLTTVIDVSAQKQAEDVVKASEKKYRSLFDEMISGYAVHEILCDPTGQPVDYRFVSVNAAFEKITGLSAAAILGKTIREILPATEPIWIERYGKVAQGGEPVKFENYSAELNKYFEVRVFSPESGVFATIFNDVTERRNAEFQREAALAEIQRLNAELEQRVVERTGQLSSKAAELERINQVFVDRELRMRELKERIKELENRIA